jgi:hypothetical protein
VRNRVFGLFAEWLDRKLQQREVEAHEIERLENALIENDIEVARRSLQPDNDKDGENNSKEEGQGRWRMVKGLPVPMVDVGQDDYWDKDLNPVVLVGPILAPAAAAAAPDGNAENDVRDNRACQNISLS